MRREILCRDVPGGMSVRRCENISVAGWHVCVFLYLCIIKSALMFRTLLKKLKRIFFFFLILAVLFLMVISIINIHEFFKDNGKTSIIIDSGTGSDPSKLFAITRALTARELEVTCLVASQWDLQPGAGRNTVQVSHSLHNSVLELMDKKNIPALQGEKEPFRLNSDYAINLSEGAAFYIEKAHKAKKSEKINIVVLGALTNLAYAIKTDPSIVNNIKVYFSGLLYDRKIKTWNKNEPHVRYDLDAVDFLLNTPGLEIYILPAGLSGNLLVNQADLYRMIQGKGEPWNLLLSGFKGSYHGQNNTEMKEVAMIESLINPKYIKISQVYGPQENYRRKVNIFSYLNITMMRSSFLNALKEEIN